MTEAVRSLTLKPVRPAARRAPPRAVRHVFALPRGTIACEAPASPHISQTWTEVIRCAVRSISNTQTSTAFR
jgi:hypothetical protein